MALKNILLTFTALPLLAACAGSNGVANVGEIVGATTADGSFEEVVTTTGVKGFMGNSDGTVDEVRVRVDMTNPSSPEFYISRNGGAEENFYLEEEPFIASIMLEEPTLEGEYDLVNDDGEELSLYIGEGDIVSMSFYGDSSRSIGSFGLQTEAANLPTETAYYYGGFGLTGSGEGYEANGGGSMNLTVDFASGKLIGSGGGGVTIYDVELEEYSGDGFDGIIIGDVDGSEMSATMTVVGGWSGELDMQGAFYGDFGSDLAGGIGGTLSNEGNDITVGGDFGASSGRFEECFMCEF